MKKNLLLSTLFFIGLATSMSAQSPDLLNDLNQDSRPEVSEGALDFVKVGPNPFTNMLYINAYVDEYFSYTLMDLAGNTLLKGEFDTETAIETSRLEPGSYVLILQPKSSSKVGSYALMKI